MERMASGDAAVKILSIYVYLRPTYVYEFFIFSGYRCEQSEAKRARKRALADLWVPRESLYLENGAF